MDEKLNRPLGPLAEKMGIVLTRFTDDICVCEMPVAGNTQPIGVLHGGANGVLAETAGSVLAVRQAPQGMRALGAHLEVNHRKPVRTGTVSCTATLDKSDGRKRWYNLVLKNDAGEVTADGVLLTVDVPSPQA